MTSLSYSLHLGNDKNKTAKAKQTSKNNISGTTSKGSNAIQNSQQLSKVCSHNLRLYEQNNNNIIVLRGSTDKQNIDVRNIYLNEFEEARIEYNSKQTRQDRIIKDYFVHISNDNKHDLACEVIIELGDMEFWSNKDLNYKNKMVNVYKKQLVDLENFVPSFKIANAVVHLDEHSPHMHIIGVPIKEAVKNGMKKQVGKTTIFTRESLTKIQDYMRENCIKEFNEEYNLDYKLISKQEGRNEDIKVSNMNNYNKIRKERIKIQEDLDILNNKIDNQINNTKSISDIINNLKPTPLKKDSFVISKEQVSIIEEYAIENNSLNKEIKDSSNIINSLDNMEKIIKTNESKLIKANNIIEEQTEQINNLEENLNNARNTISKLKSKVFELENALTNFKSLWNKVISFFRNKFIMKDSNTIKLITEMNNKKIINENDYNKIIGNVPSSIKEERKR